MNIARFVFTIGFGMANLAFATPVAYSVFLSGPAESPVNNSPGIGTATIVLDTAAHSLSISAAFSGLQGLTTMSHIHCCTPVPLTGTAGVATQTPSFVGFPLNVTSGTYANTFDTLALSTYNPAFVTANGGTAASAEAVFFNGIAAGETYLNIHTTSFPGGEIRGFLVQAPEPGTFGLAAFVLAGLAAASGKLRA